MSIAYDREHFKFFLVLKVYLSLVENVSGLWLVATIHLNVMEDM